MMETPPKIAKFSSCRGVSFEIKPHLDRFTISANIPEPPQSKRFWFSMIKRSMSRQASSHFCDSDFENDNEENDGTFEDLEENCEKEDARVCPLPLTKSIRKQPSKTNDSRLSVILLDQGLFTVYKHLFLVSIALNITVLVLSATGNFPYGKRKATLFSIGNIFVLTLCRSEVFLRIIFYLAVKIFGPSWVPLLIKKAVTSFLQSLGGVHSGCGVSSISWLIYSIILALKNKENTTNEIIVVASIILILLILSSLAAFPLVRHLHHNVFERTHRVAGWFALALLWSFIFLTISYDPETKSNDTNIGSKMINAEEFWLTLGITVMIILPWLGIRRVPVKIASPSNHASIIKFERGVKAGLLGRISPSPLSEWHAFGIISDGKEGHMMLASAVGDFTRSLVSDPPSHLWVRQVHFTGLPYLTNLYKRVLLVATGSGICVFLSFLLQPSTAEVCVLWVAKGIEQNFGNEIKDWVSNPLNTKAKVIVHDTAVLGRSNVSRMSVDAAKIWGAEVVVVTSNPKGSRDVVNACKDAGISAFGPIWDS